MFFFLVLCFGASVSLVLFLVLYIRFLFFFSPYPPLIPTFGCSHASYASLSSFWNILSVPLPSPYIHATFPLVASSCYILCVISLQLSPMCLISVVFFHSHSLFPSSATRGSMHSVPSLPFRNMYRTHSFPFSVVFAQLAMEHPHILLLGTPSNPRLMPPTDIDNRRTD